MSTASDSASLLAQRQAQVAKAASNITPVFVSRAKGAEIWDAQGQRYIDFAGGIGVVNVGHCNEKVVAAVKDQAERFLHTCFHVVMYEPYLEVCERLNQLTPGSFAKKTVLINTGAESVENAVKIARNYTNRSGIIVAEGAFHGRTLLTMSMTSKVKPYKYNFGPFAPEIYRIPYAYCYRCSYNLTYPGCGLACAHHLEDFFLEQVAAEQTAALVLEPVQGEGGFIVPPPDYLSTVAEICRRHGILFVADEVQTGICRTGKVFACEHFGVEPDLVTVAKSLAAGLPLAAVVGRAEVMDAAIYGGLGGTYGGNPLACRAALAVLDFIAETDLAARAAQIGEIMRQRFLAMQERLPLIGDVRGLGAMMGLELVTDRQTKTPASAQAGKLVQYCHAHGLVLLNCGKYGNIIRTLMPLVITDEQLDEGLRILEAGLEAAGQA